MRKIIGALLCLAMPVLLVFVPAASAVPGPVRSLSVNGTATELFPAFDPTVTRYGLTTDATTGGTVTVTATTSDPAGHVWIAGNPASGPTPVTGLSAGDEISVIISDLDGRTAYSVVYLPAGFPKISISTHQAGLAAGLVGLTLNTFEASPLPAYDAIIDRNGVPVYAVPALQSDLDLKQQPNGDVTVSRLTNAVGHSGTSLVTLDDQLAEASRQDVVAPLTNTDGHDSIKLANGDTILIGYEYNSGTGKTDATIQKLDPSGAELFRWDSSALVGETVASPQVQAAQGIPGDYAHINSVESVGNGDIIASFRHLSAVLRIATVAHDGYQPGDIIWKLGGRDSTFTFVADPYLSGPCAQHTASELPDGHILIFDNGSNGLCVDPADPASATLARGATRITEYALNTTLNTATLVWSYAPANTYALFAGSARRVAGGNTLIGWADNRDALATEIASDNTILWEARTPDALSGHKKYVTYRASLITALPDKIDPGVRFTGPAEGATVVAGDVVPAGATCSDRGGSNLADCTVTGLSNGRLNTATTGSRSWTVTAVDGAGNTTTTTRHYTVRAPVRLADGLIRRADYTVWKGNNIRGSAVNQTVLQAAHRGTATTSYWKVQNDGDRGDAFRLAGTAGTTGFRVRYWTGGQDVTASVVAGTFRTTTLAPGRTITVRVVITPTRAARVGATRTFTLRTTSVSSVTALDRVAVAVTARR